MSDPFLYVLECLYVDLKKETSLEIVPEYHRPLQSIDFLTDGQAKTPLKSFSLQLNDLLWLKFTYVYTEIPSHLDVIYCGLYHDYSHPSGKCQDTVLLSFEETNGRHYEYAKRKIKDEIEELYLKANRLYFLKENLRFFCVDSQASKTQVIHRLSKYLLDNQNISPNGEILINQDENLKQLFGKDVEKVSICDSFAILAANMTLSR